MTDYFETGTIEQTHYLAWTPSCRPKQVGATAGEKVSFSNGWVFEKGLIN